MQFKLSIVIPTHQRPIELRNVLAGIYSQNIYDNLSISIVVVVDEYNDDTVRMLQSTFPDVHIVLGDGSWWYTKSMNKGFEYAIKYIEPDFLLTLNDDIVLADNYFKVLNETIINTDSDTIVGSIGITKSQPYRIVTSGNKWRNKYLGIYMTHIPFLEKINIKELTGIYPSKTLCGRGILIPASVLKQLNGFDERFKQYHSDEDFTLRAKKEGYKICISWDLKIFVFLEKTSRSTSFLNNSIKRLIRSYFDPVSRNYLPSISRYKWRHHTKLLWPLIIFIFFSVSIKNCIIKGKKL
jgi:GT2 family glycosyltransferase